MKDSDYEKAKNLLYQIDSISSQVDLVKEQWNAHMNECGTAKLLVHIGEKTYETILTEDTLFVTLNAMLKRYKALIKEAQDELNSIIAQVTPME